MYKSKYLPFLIKKRIKNSNFLATIMYLKKRKINIIKTFSNYYNNVKIRT